MLQKVGGEGKTSTCPHNLLTILSINSDYLTSRHNKTQWFITAATTVHHQLS